MADLKFSELPSLAGTPEDTSLLALSEDDGMANFESKGMTLAQLKALLATGNAGVYTPTISNIVNVAANTAYECQYMRVGNIVTVSGKVNIDITASGAFQVEITLPIASDFTTTTELNGTSVANIASPTSEGRAVLYANSTNDEAILRGTSNVTSPTDYFFTFQYEVL